MQPIWADMGHTQIASYQQDSWQGTWPNMWQYTLRSIEDALRHSTFEEFHLQSYAVSTWASYTVSCCTEHCAHFLVRLSQCQITCSLWRKCCGFINASQKVAINKDTLPPFEAELQLWCICSHFFRDWSVSKWRCSFVSRAMGDRSKADTAL